MCYENGTLPHEEGFSWARGAERKDLEDYCFFPGGISPHNNDGQGL